MGVATRKTSKRTPPATLRSQKDIARQSPMSRLRSRSYSHDNELYRMGLRKDAEGEWAVPAESRVPAGLVNAMRALRLRSIKREPVDDEEVGVAVITGGDEVLVITGDQNNRDAAADHFRVFSSAEDGADDDVLMVDMMDSTAVYEEIRIYLDVDREIEGGHVMVDEDGYELKTVMHSVEEVNMDFELDVKMSGVSADLSVDVERLDGAGESLASIAEGHENDMDLDSPPADDQQRSESDGLTGEGSTPPKTKKPHKWSEEQLHYIGALSDAGYKLPEIVTSVATKYPGIGEITEASITFCRTFELGVARLQQSRLLGQELGLESGKWPKMKRRLILIDQEHERHVVMEQQKQELDAGNKELRAALGFETRREVHLKMHNMFVAQRTRWREFMTAQFEERHAKMASYKFAEWRNMTGLDHLVQLTMLVRESKDHFRNYPYSLEGYVYPTENQQRLMSKWETLYWNKSGKKEDTDEDRRACEYDLAMLYLEDIYGPAAGIDYHHEVAGLLSLDEETLEHDMKLKRTWTEMHWSRRMLDVQQNQRSLAFVNQKIHEQPLRASQILGLLYGCREETWLMQMLLSAEESEKINLEAGLKSARTAIELEPNRKDEILQKFYKDELFKTGQRQHQIRNIRIQDRQDQRRALFQRQAADENGSATARPQPLEASELTDIFSGWTPYGPKNVLLNAFLTAEESELVTLEASLRTARAAIELDPDYKRQQLVKVYDEHRAREEERRERILHDQQTQRRAKFQQQRQANGNLPTLDEPLEVSSILAFSSGSSYRRELVYALITEEEEEKVRIEAGLRELMRLDLLGIDLGARTSRSAPKEPFRGDPLSSLWTDHLRRQRTKEAEMPENKHLSVDTLDYRANRRGKAESNGLQLY